MKAIDKYYEMDIQSESKAFEFLIDNLRETIRTYDFFVAWDKVLANTSKVEVALNILNSLIGKNDIKNKLIELIKTYPEIVPVIPLLIAVRNISIKVADIGGDIEYSFIKRKKYSDEELESIVHFASECGLLKMLADKNIKNLVDYCLGVEVGLDTNARKNRSGTAMEKLTEIYIQHICNKNNCRYLIQATAKKIKEEFNKDIPTDKSDRHFDFVINTDSKIYLLETNYYSGGGSKLKATAGEYKSLFELVNSKDVGFIWITDGKGWNTAKRPLYETFIATDFVLNLKMVENGLLEEIVLKRL